MPVGTCVARAEMLTVLIREQRWASHQVAQCCFTVKDHLDLHSLCSPAQSRSTMHAAKSLMCSHVLCCSHGFTAWWKHPLQTVHCISVDDLMKYKSLEQQKNTSCFPLVWLSGGQGLLKDLLSLPQFDLFSTSHRWSVYELLLGGRSPTSNTVAKCFFPSSPDNLI